MRASKMNYIVSKRQPIQAIIFLGLLETKNLQEVLAPHISANQKVLLLYDFCD